MEPDFPIWKEYAYKAGIHAAIISYLEIQKNNFYKIENTIDGKTFATARGWSDLSDMIHLYEELEITVDEKLISQYIQNPQIAKNFAIYYDLYKKYQSDYQVDQILLGKATDEIKMRAREAKFDERLSLVSLLLEAITEEIQKLYMTEKTLMAEMEILKNIRLELAVGKENIDELLAKNIKSLEGKIENGKISSAHSNEQILIFRLVIEELINLKATFQSDELSRSLECFGKIKDAFAKQTKDLKKKSTQIGTRLDNIFKFMEATFDAKQELLIFVTELTNNYYTAYYISRYGVEPVNITIKRNGEEMTLENVVFAVATDDASGYVYGQADFYVNVSEKNIATVIKNGFFESCLTIRMLLDSLADLFSGAYGVEDLSGPVGVTTVIADAAKTDAYQLFYIFVFIAMNLGVMNLLPFPALDGGRLIVLCIELIIRRPLNKNVEGYINMAGMIILFAFMAFITVKDIGMIIQNAMGK